MLPGSSAAYQSITARLAWWMTWGGSFEVCSRMA